MTSAGLGRHGSGTYLHNDERFFLKLLHSGETNSCLLGNHKASVAEKRYDGLSGFSRLAGGSRSQPSPSTGGCSRRERGRAGSRGGYWQVTKNWTKSVQHNDLLSFECLKMALLQLSEECGRAGSWDAFPSGGNTFPSGATVQVSTLSLAYHDHLCP